MDSIFIRLDFKAWVAERVMVTSAIKIRVVFLAFCALTLNPYALPTQAFNSNRVHAHYQNGDFDKVIKELVAFEKSGRACSYNDSIFFEKHLAVVYASNPATRELGRYHMHKLLDLAPSAELLDMFVGDEVDKVYEKVRKEHLLANSIEPPKLANPTKPNKQPKSIKPSVLARKPNPMAAPVQAAGSNNSQSLSQNGHQSEIASSPSASPSPSPARPKPVEPTPVAFEDRPSHSMSPAEHPTLVSDTLPVWKQKGVWIGGGAAMAVIAFALYYSGSPEETATKTYVVPATAAK